jgi:hypothetical protein
MLEIKKTEKIKEEYIALNVKYHYRKQEPEHKAFQNKEWISKDSLITELKNNYFSYQDTKQISYCECIVRLIADIEKKRKSCKCGGTITFYEFDGDKNYWSCDKCNQEKVMFGVK